MTIVTYINNMKTLGRARLDLVMNFRHQRTYRIDYITSFRYGLLHDLWCRPVS